MAASCLGSMWPPASPPKINSATSPGMTRMITKTRAAAPSSVGTIRSRRLAMYVPIPRSPWSGSILRQPDVLELLVGVVIGRSHVVLHLGPVHDVARPPEPRHVIGVFEHDLLKLQDQLLALGRVESPRLPREQVVDSGIGESAPILGFGGLAGGGGRQGDQNPERNDGEQRPVSPGSETHSLPPRDVDV